MVKKLYEICLNQLINNFESVEDLQYVPFDPFITDILNYIIETDTLNSKKGRPLGKTILRKIGESHGKHFREEEYLHYGSFSFIIHSLKTTSVDLSYFIQHGAPQLITRLDLSMTPIKDDDLVHLKSLTNLVVLDLTNTLISDTGMSHIASFTQPDNITSRMASLSHLNILSVAYCQFITDRSLRYIPKMKRSLIGIDFTTTLINPNVANTFLLEHGYQRVSDLPSNHYYNNINKKALTTTTIATDFHFRYRSSSSDTIASPTREMFRKLYCPQHLSSLVTYCNNKLPEGYGSKIKTLNNEKSNPGYRIQQNEFLNNVMNGDNTFNPYINGSDNYKEWMSWWKRNGDEAKKDLIFILKKSTIEHSSNRKRPLELEKYYNHDSGLNSPVKRKNVLKVKQTMDAAAFLQNFQF